MSMGLATVRCEFATQASCLKALNLQISDANVSTNFLFETAPKRLEEIEKEVRIIAERSSVFDKTKDNPLPETRKYVNETLNATRLSLYRAQQSGKGNTQLNEQDFTIYSTDLYKEFINKLAQAEKLLGLKPLSFTNHSSSSSSSSTNSTFFQ